MDNMKQLSPALLKKLKCTSIYYYYVFYFPLRWNIQLRVSSIRICIPSCLFLRMFLTYHSGRSNSCHTFLRNNQKYSWLFRISYRDHKNYCVENNSGHDKDFKGFGVHNLPHFINTSVFILRHVTLSWFGCHGELNAISLKYKI